jgi:hypothetical protein
MSAYKVEPSSLCKKGSNTGERGLLEEGRLVVLPGDLCEGELKGWVRLLNPEPPHQWTGHSLRPEQASLLLREGKVQLIRKSKGRVRGVFPVLQQPESGRYSLRGSSLGQPKRSGASWLQEVLPDWAGRDTFSQVINSCCTQPVKRRSRDAIAAVGQAGRQTERQGKLRELPKRRDEKREEKIAA